MGRKARSEIDCLPKKWSGRACDSSLTRCTLAPCSTQIPAVIMTNHFYIPGQPCPGLVLISNIMFNLHDQRGALLEDRGLPVELECTAILLHQMQRSFAASLIRFREPSPFGSVWRHADSSLRASIDHGVHELRSTCQPYFQNSSRLSDPSACRRDDQGSSAIFAQARYKASCLKYWHC